MKTKKKNKKIAVLGYGSQGRSLALNLIDSGYDLTVGLKSISSKRTRAKKDGVKNITTIAKAVRACDILIFALPDHLQGRIYQNEIETNLNQFKTLVFLHGFSIHFQTIIPPQNCDVILLAPHAPGVAVREKYQTERNVSAFYAIKQNISKQATQTLFELAESVGFKKSKLVKTTFEDEALGDLFGEQAVLCGGLTELIMAGYRTLVKNGLSEEKAYLEVAYQLDLIVALIKNHGIKGMFERISVAARYGAVENGDKIIDSSVEKKMDKLFKLIKSGSFAKNLSNITDNELQKINQKIDQKTDPAFEKAAKKFSK